MNAISAQAQSRCIRLAGKLTSHRGFDGVPKAAYITSLLLGGKNSTIVEMPEGRLAIELVDGYWAKMLVPGFTYEPEVRWLFDFLLRRDKWSVLDCGANIGYWSIIASHYPGALNVLAIEACPPTHKKLTNNWQLNSERFEVAPPTAVWSSQGSTIEIVTNDRWHAGASVVENNALKGEMGCSSFSIPTDTIDRLAAPFDQSRILLKLDIEGAEIPALTGASHVLDRNDTVIVYEDHGRDDSCAVSAYLLDAGFQVGGITSRGVRQVRDLSEVRLMKFDSRVGYNFVAARSLSDLQTMLP
jgi:FkbM family methyltransferase